MACIIVSSDPEFILNMLCMREMEENGEVMKSKESEGDEMGNNNELRDNGEGGGMDVDSNEGGGMDVDSDEGGVMDVDSDEGGGMDVDSDEGGGMDVDSDEGGGMDVDSDEGGGMDVDSGEGGGMDVDSVPISDNIPAFDGSSSGVTEDISGDEPVDIYQKFITKYMIQLILRKRQTFMGISMLTVASTFFSSILAPGIRASFDVS